eukprot:SAG22_NODE_9637_length_578_cov_0.962422_1_plen_103_part_01
MCPPTKCCCCGIALGLKVNCLVLAFVFFLGIIGGFSDLAVFADFCDTVATEEHLANAEAGTLDAGCDGDECNVRETGKWIDLFNDVQPEVWHGPRAADSGPFP